MTRVDPEILVTRGNANKKALLTSENIFQNKTPINEAVSHINTFLTHYWYHNNILFKKWKHKNAEVYGWSPPNDNYVK